MFEQVRVYALAILSSACLAVAGCSGGGGSELGDDNTDDGSGGGDSGSAEQGNAGTPGILHDAYQYFGTNVTISLDQYDVVIEATGRPDHTSAYWDPSNSSGLYVAPDPSITTESRMSPGFIEDYNNLYTLRVPTSPSLATSPSSTTLGAVGIATSGAPIFNDQEGGNVNLNTGVISGFDRNGAHTGPETYHYHLEPRAISYDDAELIGVIADGFFIYGRRCYSDPSTYPSDLDVSGGHFATTQHSGTTEEYHYHIMNDAYLGSYYLLFPEDYQGTPNSISR